jgi:hypothetical protein
MEDQNDKLTNTSQDQEYKDLKFRSYSCAELDQEILLTSKFIPKLK